jgi:DtxR family Mn-dependent transcriptional regulator
MGKAVSAKRASKAAEDYLKAILRLHEDGRPATTGAIAERLGVSQPSVTAMTKKLAAEGLVERMPYRGVTLTRRGRLIALEVLRHHRLLERFLVDTLGVPLEDVHAEAERLEHVLSEELEARIDAALGFPTQDPHGDPIPDRRLKVTAPDRRALSDLETGERSTVAGVPDNDSELLRYLAELELVPGAPIEVLAYAPFGGPLTVRSRSGQHAIGRELAAAIAVV